MKKRHLAGTVTYPGDVTHIVGEVKGPLTYRALVVAVAAVYDKGKDITRVTFGHMRGDDQAEFVEPMIDTVPNVGSVSLPKQPQIRVSEL